MEVASSATRRRHGAELKTRVLGECAASGASVAAIALAHGLNANLVHRWRRLAARGSSTGLQTLAAPGSNEPRFVPVRLPQAAAPQALDIRIELRRGATSVALSWPVAAAAECANWLGEWLR